MKHECADDPRAVPCGVCHNLTCKRCAGNWDEPDVTGFRAYATCQTCCRAIDSGSQEQIEMAKARR